MKSMVLSLALGVAVALSVGAGCNASSSNNCSFGLEGCACNADGSCDAGLSCLSNTCVSTLQDGSGGGGAVDGGGTGGSELGTGGGTGGSLASGGTGGGGPSCEFGDRRGACGDGNAEYCEGEWVEADCGGCDVLSMPAACVHVRAFGMDAAPSYALNDAVVTGFSQSASAVRGMYGLQLGQFGVLQFGLADVNPRDITLSAANSGFTTMSATLENSDGTAGCSYSLFTSGGTRSFYQAEEDGCWGSFEPMTGASAGTQPDVLNLRVVAQQQTSTTLEVTGVTFL